MSLPSQLQRFVVYTRSFTDQSANTQNAIYMLQIPPKERTVSWAQSVGERLVTPLHGTKVSVDGAVVQGRTSAKPGQIVTLEAESSETNGLTVVEVSFSVRGELPVFKICGDMDLVDSVDPALSVLKFGAEWCGPCSDIAPVFASLEKDFSQIAFSAYDVDEETDLAEQYDVCILPTFCFLKGNEVVDRLEGADESVLRAKVNKLSQSHQ